MKTKWLTKKLGEICDFQNGLWTGKKPPYKKVQVLRNTNFKNNDGTLNYDDVAEIEVEEKQLLKRLLQPGDIILERSGGGPTQPVGRVAFFEKAEEFSFSNFTSRVRVLDIDKLYPKFLHWFLILQYVSGKTENLQKQTTGIRNLIFAEYKEIEIPLPPLDEQKRIVKVLEKKLGKVKAAISLRQDAIADTEKILSAKLSEIFTEGKEEYFGIYLDKLATLVRGPFGGSLTKQMFVDKGYAVYEQGNVIGDQTSEFRYFIDDEKYREMERFAVLEGDILMSCSGTIGKFTYIKDNYVEGIINQALLKITPNLEKITRDYLQYALIVYLNNSTGHIKGGAIKNIVAVKELKKIRVPVPDLKTQEKIVKELDELSARVASLRALQKQQLADLKSLERAYLHEAFSGEL